MKIEDYSKIQKEEEENKKRIFSINGKVLKLEGIVKEDLLAAKVGIQIKGRIILIGLGNPLKILDTNINTTLTIEIISIVFIKVLIMKGKGIPILRKEMNAINENIKAKEEIRKVLKENLIDIDS